jgi:mRNA interferase RelE/StbE
LTDFRIFETDQFQKDVKELSRSGLPKLAAKLREHVYPQLRSNPATGPNIKRLKGPYSGVWRYRIGAWRFFYTIDASDRIVSMIAAAHRSRAY